MLASSDIVFLGGESLPLAATAWAATPSSGDTPQRPEYSVPGRPLAGRLMLRPPAHCPPTENVLPFPKAAIPLARAVWETTREQEMKLRAPLAPEHGKTPFRCAALCHCRTPTLHPRIFALSKGRGHGSAPPPFHRRPLSATLPVRWCARPFCRASSTWLRTCHRPRPCLTGINAAHHSPQCEHGISPACDFGRTASLSRPRHHARETPVVERSAPQSQARQDLALPSQAFPGHERSPHAYGDRQGAFGASKGCP